MRMPLLVLALLPSLAFAQTSPVFGGSRPSGVPSSGGTFTGPVAASNLSGTNSGDVTLTTVGSSPSANGASLSGQALTLQPADDTHPGVVTSGTQTIGGDKTFTLPITTPGVTATTAIDTASLTVATSASVVGCDTSLIAGAATCNQSAGRSAIAASASSVVITNSSVAATSMVLITPQTADAVCKSMVAVPAAGSFTVTANATCTADTKFGWLVVGGISPLFAPVSGEIAHVVWTGTGIADLIGNSWAMVGTVAQQVQVGRVPAGGKTFTPSNYYSLGTGNDVLDVADFSACMVVTPTAYDTANTSMLLANNGAGTSPGTTTNGYQLVAYETGYIRWFAGASGSPTSTPLLVGVPNIVCFGVHSGYGRSYMKVNLRSISTGNGGVHVPDTVGIAKLGVHCDLLGGLGFQGTIHEFQFGPIAVALYPDWTGMDAYLTPRIQEIHDRLKITAW